MSLTSALGIAQSALLNTSRQTQVTARNIQNAHDPDYSRRLANSVSTAPGARVVSVSRMADDALFRQNLLARSAHSAQSTLMAGLDRASTAVNGADNAGSAAVAIGRLQEALQIYSASPSNRNLAEAAVEAARSVVSALNQGSAEIQAFRSDLDRQVGSAVAELNGLLEDFQDVNREVVEGTRAGRDTTDALDRRDALLKKISDFLPISTITRGDNDMVIMTGDGATLFETIPRKVTFELNPLLGPGTLGNAIRVDGVPIKPGVGGNTSASGSLAAMVQLRDVVAVQMQAQLDEVARGLILSFSEAPGTAGLFDTSLLAYPGGGLSNGLARDIRINPAYNSQAGGTPEALRDGATGTLNPTGAPSYADRLLGYLAALDTPMGFDDAAGLPGNVSVSAYSANAIGWLEASRQSASSALDTKSALMMRTSAALSNATGVNMDQEMALLLDLEHSYAASAKLLQTVNDMLTSLIAAVR